MKNGVISAAVFLLIINLLIISVSAEKLDIQVENNYIPGQEINFKLILYDDENNKINGKINYIIQNYYSEIIRQGVVDSGNSVIFALPENAIQGPWKISADYNNVEISRLFNVGALEKAGISLEGDILIITNTGNVPYEKKILIYIGQEDQTAQIFLEVGQTKEIRLTAPDGKYDIKVIEGNNEKTLEFNDVSLTGNAVGLERILENNGFWQKNRIVVLFLGTLLIVVIVIAGLKIKNKSINIKINNKNKN